MKDKYCNCNINLITNDFKTGVSPESGVFSTHQHQSTFIGVLCSDCLPIYFCPFCGKPVKQKKTFEENYQIECLPKGDFILSDSRGVFLVLEKEKDISYLKRGFDLLSVVETFELSIDKIKIVENIEEKVEEIKKKKLDLEDREGISGIVVKALNYSFSTYFSLEAALFCLLAEKRPKQLQRLQKFQGLIEKASDILYNVDNDICFFTFADYLARYMEQCYWKTVEEITDQYYELIQ